jgi:hypothetical protein
LLSSLLLVLQGAAVALVLSSSGAATMQTQPAAP